MVLKDPSGHLLKIPPVVDRVISVVPSITELIFDLGLDDEVLAVTKFCVRPKDKVAGKPKVGGTKNLDLPHILKLKPQLILANKEENEQSQIMDLSREVSVWVSDIQNFQQALTMIETLGQMLNRETTAVHMTQHIQREFSKLVLGPELKRALYLIWRKPYMSVGRDTFISDMMFHAGYHNVVTAKRYPILSPDQIAALNPQEILLSSEPFPFKEKHMDELQNICPAAQVKLVDGEIFSWYGSRLLNAPDYFMHLQAVP